VNEKGKGRSGKIKEKIKESKKLKKI